MGDISSVADISRVAMMGWHGGCSRDHLNLTPEMSFSSTIAPTDVETSSNYIRSMRETLENLPTSQFMAQFAAVDNEAPFERILKGRISGG